MQTLDIDPTSPATRRRRGPWPRLADPVFYSPAAFVLALLVGWEIVGRQVDPLLFAPPSRVAGAFVDLVASGDLIDALLTTVNALLVGFALSMLVGLPVGVLLGRGSVVGRVLEPYIDAIYATPRVVIVPLVIIWFGVGYVGTVFLVWLGAVVPVMINTAYGVRNARPDLIEVARSFGVARHHMVLHVLIPGALPYVVAGLRIAAGRAVIGVLVAEIFLQNAGLGGLIQTNAAFFRTASMLAAVVVVGLLGAAFSGSLSVLEKRVAPWKTAGQAD
jgi:ABC-type nitrate/sulfonate/bicarbonate transport system permease component